MTILTVEQKASLTSGATTWTTCGVEGVADFMHMSDGPHGLRFQGVEGDSLGIESSVPATCFPPAAGLASSWDRDIIRLVGQTLGEEARDLGVSVLLGPGLNIKRSPLGGRNFEYASEDPFLAGEYGVSFVRGVQSEGVSAVPKHFAANNQETDRFRVSARIDERTLREIYLPAFETTVKMAKPWAIMCAYNKINGVYASQNSRLLTTILRDEWGFDGVVVSDWGAVVDRVAAVQSGLDIEMPPSGTDSKIVDAVKAGELSEAVLDKVVQRVHLLSERTQSVRLTDRTAIDFQGHDLIARKAAQESVVLLKNEGVLPIRSHQYQSLAIIGEFARTPRYQGGGSSHVTSSITHNLLSEMRLALPDTRITFSAGYTTEGNSRDNNEIEEYIEEAARNAAEAELAIVNVGYMDGDESEGLDKKSLDLREDQQKLLEAVLDTGTPTVVVLSGGGVIGLGSWSQRCSALLEGWLLGQAGGAALADVLTGLVSPSGRLNETIPLSLDDTPSRLNFPGADGVVNYGEGLFVGYRYYDTLKLPVAYPFGFGLSYADFAYSDLSVQRVGPCSVEVSFTVTNTGDCEAADVPQIYVASGQKDRPKHELKGFERVVLKPGESTRVCVQLGDRSFATWNIRDSQWRVYPGRYNIELSHSSRDVVLSQEIELEGDEFIPELDGMSTIGEWLANPYGEVVINPMVQSIQAKFGSEQPSPELYEMFLQMPLVKLTAWGFGFTEGHLQAMVDKVHELRSRNNDDSGVETSQESV